MPCFTKMNGPHILTLLKTIILMITGIICLNFCSHMSSIHFFIAEFFPACQSISGNERQPFYFLPIIVGTWVCLKGIPSNIIKQPQYQKWCFYPPGNNNFVKPPHCTLNYQKLGYQNFRLGNSKAAAHIAVHLQCWTL